MEGRTEENICAARAARLIPLSSAKKKIKVTSDEDHGSVGQHSHASISRLVLPMQAVAVGITKSLAGSRGGKGMEVCTDGRTRGRRRPIRSQVYFQSGGRSSGAPAATALGSSSSKHEGRLSTAPFRAGDTIQHPTRESLQTYHQISQACHRRPPCFCRALIGKVN